MKMIQRVIYTGFAAVALASAAMPVFPAHDMASRPVLHGPDFAWYADVGRLPHAVVVSSQPAPREGWIWAPQRWEWNGRNHVWVEGHWIRDDYAEQVAMYNPGVPATQVARAHDLPRGVIIEDRR
jgi:hypothetical protein